MAHVPCWRLQTPADQERSIAGNIGPGEAKARDMAARGLLRSELLQAYRQTQPTTTFGQLLVAASKQSASGPETHEIDSKPIAASSVAIASGFLQTPSSKAPRPQRQLLRPRFAPRRFREGASVSGPRTLLPSPRAP